MRNSPFWWLLVGFMVVLDIYVFQTVKFLSHSSNPKSKIIIYSVYWVLSAGAIIILLLLPYIKFEHQAKIFRTTVFAIIAGLFFAKLSAAVLFFVDDLRRLIKWMACKIFFIVLAVSIRIVVALVIYFFIIWWVCDIFLLSIKICCFFLDVLMWLNGSINV